MQELALYLPRTARIFDAGMGTGVLGRAARRSVLQAQVTGIDLIKHAPWEPGLLAYAEVLHGDFLDLTPWGPGWDLVISNPPYSQAMEFIEQSVRMLEPRGLAAMLVNMHVLGSGARAFRWKQLCTRLLGQRMLAPRPKFDERGTDSTEYAWLLFGGADARLHPRLPAFDWYTRPGLVDDLLKAERRTRDKQQVLEAAAE